MDQDLIRMLVDVVREHGVHRPEKVAIDFESRSVTYGELHHRSDQVAGMFLELGVKPGDRLAWLGRTSETWFELFFGACKARACFTPINSRLSVSEITFVLDDSTADIIFVSPEFMPTAAEVVDRIRRPIRIIEAGGPGAARYLQMRDAAPAPKLEEPLLTDDVLQVYTSGTTGLPKGVRLTNSNYAAFLETVPRTVGFQYQADDTVLVLLPMFHVGGINSALTGLAAASRLIVHAEFVPPRVLEAIENERVNHIMFVPAMINALVQTPGADATNFSSLRSVAYAASPISEAVLTRAMQLFGCGFVQFYAMTETTGIGTTLPPHCHQGELLRSCGHAMPAVEVRIAGDQGQTLGPGEIGEIEIRGPVVMAGYWNRPEATAETVRLDGWMRTGDAGYRDKDGYFFIHDRVKDMIVSGGENVYPAEVENAILGCPGIADVAVIGVPDERWGEAVKAIVVATEGANPDPQAVIAHARARIAGYKVPRSVDFVDVLPRNASGKVLRRELRKVYWEGRGRLVN